MDGGWGNPSKEPILDIVSDIVSYNGNKPSKVPIGRKR